MAAAAMARLLVTAGSVAWIFGDLTGDLLAHTIHTALAAYPQGLTRTDIRDLLGRHRPATAIDGALATLACTGRASSQRLLTAGRPAVLWTAAVPSR
ncbi:MAG: hypothetical protein ACYCX9_01290 [Candidatus Dormibacteria bacterium]|jgi:hypothetical protein